MKRNYGLQDLTPDDRDFQLGGFDTLPTILPEEFILPYNVKDQTSTDWCSAFATCAASEVQEEIELEPGYSFAASKELTGDPDTWGQNLRDACKAHQKYGALPRENMTERLYKLPLKERRYWEHWKTLLPLALMHKKKSYFRVTGPNDDYDNIKASIYKYKTPVVTGITFGYPITQTHLEKVKDGFGHAMAIVGWTPTHLIILNSYGTKAGDKGVHYISREVVNHHASRFGAFTFLDVDPEDVNKKRSWLYTFLKRIYVIIMGGK